MINYLFLHNSLVGLESIQNNRKIRKKFLSIGMKKKNKTVKEEIILL